MLLFQMKKKEGSIDINFKSNDTKNNINKDFKVNKIINLEPGDQLSKIIISNLLKISKDINEEEEIKLSKEYQVLSKNTSLYGEIIKDEINKQGKLIKVNLNQNNKRTQIIKQRPQTPTNIFLNLNRRHYKCFNSSSNEKKMTLVMKKAMPMNMCLKQQKKREF